MDTRIDQLEVSEIASASFASPRRVWIQRARQPATDGMIFLDAELYLNRVGAARLVEEWQNAAETPPFDCLYLSSLNAGQRHVEYTCHEPFADFFAFELISWMQQNLGNHERYWLCGLSLSGLAAIFTALRHSRVFSGAIAQSPSAWWNREWLSNSVPRFTPITGRFWISVGDRELDENVSHPPTGLFQEVNQLGSCRRLSQQLTANCADLRHVEFAGGHDPQCWARELPDALQWLLDPASRR